MGEALARKGKKLAKGKRKGVGGGAQFEASLPFSILYFTPPVRQCVVRAFLCACELSLHVWSFFFS